MQVVGTNLSENPQHMLFSMLHGARRHLKTERKSTPSSWSDSCNLEGKYQRACRGGEMTVRVLRTSAE